MMMTPTSSSWPAQALLAIGLLCSLAAAGCGAPSGTATGTASYNGQPIKRGAITFTPADGNGPVVGGAITQGAYTVARHSSGT